MSSDPRFAVVMAGGQGTRFWPRSRRRLPKQLLSIASRRTMLQETVRRIRRLYDPARILVVTGAAYATEVRRQLPSIPKRNVVVEPMGRNTAPCIALAAELIHARSPEATMAVLPADHIIADVEAFHRALKRALSIAEKESCLVTFGVQPTRAETGYGYIEVGRRWDDEEPAAHRVRAFHEKPSLSEAARYVARRRHLWNSGMFVWRTSVIRRAIAGCLPDLASAMSRVGRATGRRRSGVLRRVFEGLEAISIDHGVVERAGNVVVVEAGFGWNDVGSWAAMPELWGTDSAGNAARGDVIALDSRGTIAFGDRRLLVLLGVEDLVVVDSGDAVLVCRRDRAQDVRLLVAELDRRRRTRLL